MSEPIDDNSARKQGSRQSVLCQQDALKWRATSSTLARRSTTRRRPTSTTRSMGSSPGTYPSIKVRSEETSELIGVYYPSTIRLAILNRIVMKDRQNAEYGEVRFQNRTWNGKHQVQWPIPRPAVLSSRSIITNVCFSYFRLGRDGISIWKQGRLKNTSSDDSMDLLINRTGTSKRM